MYTHSIVYTRSSGPCVGLPSSLFAHQGSIPWQLGVEVTSISAAVSCHAMSTGLPYAHNPTTLATYLRSARQGTWTTTPTYPLRSFRGSRLWWYRQRTASRNVRAARAAPIPCLPMLTYQVASRDLAAQPTLSLCDRLTDRPTGGC